jgi:hypothetical protein
MKVSDRKRNTAFVRTQEFWESGQRTNIATSNLKRSNHTITLLQSCYSLAHGLNFSTKFMAQDIPLLQLNNGPMQQMQITSADRSSRDFQYDISVLDYSRLWNIALNEIQTCQALHPMSTYELPLYSSPSIPELSWSRHLDQHIFCDLDLDLLCLGPSRLRRHDLLLSRLKRLLGIKPLLFK